MNDSDTRYSSAPVASDAPELMPPASPAPLLPVAVGLALGIIVDCSLTPPAGLSLVVLVVGGLLFSQRNRWDAAAVAGVLFASIALGMLRHAVADRRLPPNHLALHVPAEPGIARIRGEIITPPRIDEPTPDVPRAYAIGPKTRFLLEARQCQGTTGPIDVCGRVMVSVKAPILTLRVGDVVDVTGWLYQPGGPRNPGEYDWARHNRRRGVRVGLSTDHAEAVRRVLSAERGGWRAWIARVRGQLRGYLLDHSFSESDPAAGVIAAMVLGERSAVPRAMNEAFIRTGNAHLLAASGMHVAWLALIGYVVCSIFGVYYRTTAVVVALLIVSYVLIAEPRPSILRAGVTGLLLCAAAFFRGRYNSINALACAAIGILLINPADLFSPAFQFSFLATVGLIHFCPLVSQAIADGLFRMKAVRLGAFFSMRAGSFGSPAAAEPDRAAAGFWLRGVVRYVLLLIPLTISEWLITTPLACYVFDQFAPWGWLGAFLAFFLALPAVVIGYVTVLGGLLFPSSGMILGPAAAGVTQAMLSIVELLGRLPNALVSGRSPSLAWAVAVYALFALWGYRRHWMPLGRGGYAVAAGLLVLWWLIPPRWTKTDSGVLNVWMLAVGDGTGTVIELPDGRTMVYDFGTRSPFDAGPLAEAFFRSRGIECIESIFISHANFDHFSAVEHVARRFRVGRVVVNDQFERFVPEGSAARHLLNALGQLGVAVETTHGPAVLLDDGGLRIEALWPPSAAERPLFEANDTSTVLKLTYGGKSVLLAGDIAEAGMASLLLDGQPKAGGNVLAIDLHADVLALPHHGSVVYNTRAFIEAVDPKVAVRSTGQRRAMTTNGIESIVGDRRFFSTAEDGCIRIRITPDGLSAGPATGRTSADGLVN